MRVGLVITRASWACDAQFAKGFGFAAVFGAAAGLPGSVY